jgi:hypothetical protein
MKNVTSNENIQWTKRPDKPILQSAMLPCSSHDLFSKLIYYRRHCRSLIMGCYVLRADVWPRYATGIFRAIVALQTKPDAVEEQRIASLGLTLESCTSTPLDHCSCNPL